MYKLRQKVHNAIKIHAKKYNKLNRNNKKAINVQNKVIMSKGQKVLHDNKDMS